MGSIMILLRLVPDKIYKRELDEIRKDVPQDVLRNIVKFDRVFGMDFSRRPGAVRRRPVYWGGNGGGGDGGGG